MARLLPLLLLAVGLLVLPCDSIGAFAEEKSKTSTVVPHTINLSSRNAPAGRGTYLKRRALEASTLPLVDFFRGTDLQWYGNISVGTPPQNITVIFDTGSVTLEFAGTACGEPCANQVKFDPSQSSTFVDNGTESSITFVTGVGVDPVVGDNYKFTLRAGKDTVSVAGLEADNVSLNIITNQTAAFSIVPFSGTMGMAADASGFLASLVSQGLPSLFSLYLTPDSVGNAEMTLGGIDSSKFQGNLTYASLPSFAGTSWFLPSRQLSVNGQTTPLLTQNRSIFFDSGTSNIMFDKNTTDALYALISPDIQPNPAEPGTYGIACDLISSLPAILDITFTSQNGDPFNLTIPSTELSVGPFANNASLCQTLINAFEGLDIVGGSLLKHYYSVWDIGSQRMGFAQLNNTQATLPTSQRSSAIPLLTVTSEFSSLFLRVSKYSLVLWTYLTVICMYL